jgi:hypothetical protein
MQKINQQLVKSLNRDIYFFKTRGLLDYSLLFAIEKTDDKTFDAAQEAKERSSDFKLMR